MNTLLTYLNHSKELIACITGSAAFSIVVLYMWIPTIDVVASQDLAQDLVCVENWIGTMTCKSRDDLMFAHRYQ